MERDGGAARCSTGFAALDSSNNSHMVTAEHCGVDKDWRTPIGHAAIGRSHAGVGHMDIMLVSGTAYSGVTYTGTYNNNIADPVVGTSEAVLGQQACPSGGYSGRDCRTTIGAVGVYIVLNGRTVGPAYRTDHNEGVASVGEGDSGGPVFSWATGSSVYAQGIVSAISTNHLGACQGFAPAGRRCATRAYHMNLRRALIEVDLDIRLG
jgi:hypothetical protein